MAERDVLHDIREALGLEPDLVLWRNNTGVFDDGRGGKVRTGLGTGSADLVGILTVTVPEIHFGTVHEYSLGRFFALEVKRNHYHHCRRGRTSEEQDRWLALVRTMGGFASVVRSVQEAKASLARARRGESQ